MASDQPTLSTHQPGAEHHRDSYDHYASRDRAIQEHQNRTLDYICRMEANVAGVKSGVKAAIGCMLADYVLQRTSQTYRCRIELTGQTPGDCMRPPHNADVNDALPLEIEPTGNRDARLAAARKVLVGSIIAYTAFYVSSFGAEKKCVRRNDVATVRHGMLPRALVAPEAVGEGSMLPKSRLSDLERADRDKLQ